jgi:hypothetical protein
MARTDRLSRNVRLMLLALCVLTVVNLLLLAAGWTRPERADAQTTATHTFVASGMEVTPVNGFATVPIAQTDGVLGVACTGNFPQGGPVVPAIVITHPEATLTRLRITSWGTNTPAVNRATVRINCAFEAQDATAAALAKAKLARLYPSAKIAGV